MQTRSTAVLVGRVIAEAEVVVHAPETMDSSIQGSTEELVSFVDCNPTDVLLMKSRTTPRIPSRSY